MLTLSEEGGWDGIKGRNKWGTIQFFFIYSIYEMHFNTTKRKKS